MHVIKWLSLRSVHCWCGYKLLTCFAELSPSGDCEFKPDLIWLRFFSKVLITCCRWCEHLLISLLTYRALWLLFLWTQMVSFYSGHDCRISYTYGSHCCFCICFLAVLFLNLSHFFYKFMNPFSKAFIFIAFSLCWSWESPYIKLDALHNRFLVFCCYSH